MTEIYRQKELHRDLTAVALGIGEGVSSPVDAVQLVVESASVADGLAVIVAPPQRRVARAAVGAALPVAPRRRLRGDSVSRGARGKRTE